MLPFIGPGNTSMLCYARTLLLLICSGTVLSSYWTWPVRDAATMVTEYTPRKSVRYHDRETPLQAGRERRTLSALYI